MRLNLNFRLNLALSAIVLVTWLGGTVFAVRDARLVVADELSSSVILASTLIELLFERAGADGLETTYALLAQMGRSIRARHLDIELVDNSPSGHDVQARTPAAPTWFVRLVEPRPLSLVRSVAIPGTALKMRIRADPADEIDESWRETRVLFVQMGSVALLVNVLGAMVIRRGARPLADIANALQQVEAGRHDVRLPRGGLRDLDELSERFNRMVEALGRSVREAADLAQRGIAIREAERRYLAQELHDELGQSISAIKALAIAIQRAAGNEDNRLARSAATIAEVSTRMYDKIRQMMSDLRPPVLDELGFVSALEHLVDHWNSVHEDLFCRLEIRGSVPPLPNAAEINLYRIVQEALTNVAKHSYATEATVSVEVTPGAPSTLTLRVRDNGVGFDHQRTPRGLGLVGIRERAAALHARAALATEPRAGTEWSFTMDLEPEALRAIADEQQNPDPPG
jgi:two-component system sensor histidine kinase UhpB